MARKSGLLATNAKFGLQKCEHVSKMLQNCEDFVKTGKVIFMTYREWLHEFSLNLKELMHEERINSKELAEMSGLSQSTISRYMNEIQMPNLRAIINLSYALHVDYDDLIEFGEPIDPKESKLPDWV